MSKAAWIQENLKPSEKYAGILLGKDGEPDHHLILLDGKGEGMSWETAKKFATLAGGELPTRREQALLFANLKEEFESRWYWSSEQSSADTDYAWTQNCSNGTQFSTRKTFEGRARAVRRLIIF